MSISREMDKENVHIYSGILLIHKKCEMMPFAATQTIILNQRQVSYDIIYMWNLKKWYKWTYLQNKTDSDLENKLMVTKGKNGKEGLIKRLGLTY